MSNKEFRLQKPEQLDDDVGVEVSVSDVGTTYIVFRDRDTNGPTMLDVEGARKLLDWLSRAFEPSATFATIAIEELRAVEREIGVPSRALKMIGCSALMDAASSNGYMCPNCANAGCSDCDPKENEK